MAPTTNARWNVKRRPSERFDPDGPTPFDEARSMPMPGPKARTTSWQAERRFTLLLEQSAALARLRQRVTGARGLASLEAYRRVGEMLAPAARLAGGSGESGVGLLALASGLPLSAIEILLEAEEAAINFDPHALVRLGRDGLSLDRAGFLALLARDAASFDDEHLAVDAAAAVESIGVLWDADA
jgi:hypothetical protein